MISQKTIDSLIEYRNIVTATNNSLTKLKDKGPLDFNLYELNDEIFYIDNVLMLCNIFKNKSQFQFGKYLKGELGIYTNRCVRFSFYLSNSEITDFYYDEIFGSYSDFGTFISDVILKVLSSLTCFDFINCVNFFESYGLEYDSLLRTTKPYSVYQRTAVEKQLKERTEYYFEMLNKLSSNEEFASLLDSYFEDMLKFSKKSINVNVD